MRSGRRHDIMDLWQIILIVVVAFPIAFYGLFFFYHRLMLIIEKNKLIPNGQLVEIDGHHCHVLAVGEKNKKAIRRLFYCPVPGSQLRFTIIKFCIPH